MMIELIPFKVKVSQEEIDRFYEGFAAPPPLKGMRHVTLHEQRLAHFVETDKDYGYHHYKDLLDIEWTVVGFDGGNFLLAHPGRVTRWFPQEFCVSVGEIATTPNSKMTL
jgi:hypothetical protein